MSSGGERVLRKIWIDQIKKEIALEKNYDSEIEEMTDDELLAELSK